MCHDLAAAGRSRSPTPGPDRNAGDERGVPGPRLVRVGRRLIARPTVPVGQRPEVDLAALVERERDR
jgi:hypothetical protein